MSDDEIEPARQRRNLKRWDERVKLTANFLNGAGIATLIVSLISPFMQGTDLLSEGHPLAGVGLAIMFHGLAQIVLFSLRSE